MRDTGFIYPVLFEVNSNSEVDNGVRIFKTDEDLTYRVRLNNPGEDLNNTEPDLSIRIKSGQSGGLPLLRTDPPDGGYMPSCFEKPLKIQLSLSEASDETDYVGQSTIFARDFKKFEVDQNTYPFRNCKNSRLFSYKGDLWLLTDSYVSTIKGDYVFVTIYKYNYTTEKFIFWYRFKEACDLDITSDTIQYGSPDFCELDGVGYIAYKTVDKISGSVYISFFEGNDTLTSWTLRSKTELPDSETDFTDYRLRMAAGLDTIMIASYGVKAYTRTSTGFSVQKNDFRTMYSSDGGYNFINKADKVSNISIDSVSGVLRSNRNLQNIYQYFTPVNEQDTYEFDLVTYTVRFALYFDDDMGCFVIMKPGSPNVNDNNTYLMGVKNVDGDFSQWEPCLKYRLTQDRNGVVPLDGNGDLDPFSENIEDDLDNSYNIHDIDIAATATRKIITLDVSLNQSLDSLDDSRGIAVSEFRFVKDSMIPPGTYQQIFAYGTKNHEEWNFVSSLINKEYGGLVGVGGLVLNNVEFGRHPMICFHRNGFVASSRQINPQGNIRDNSSLGINTLNELHGGFRYLTFLAPWSNIGERFGYEFAYTGYDDAFSSWPFTKTEASSGSVDHSDVSHAVEFDLGTGSSTAYLTYDYSVASYPDLLELSEDFTDGNFWKCRFEMYFDLAPSTTLDFFECNVGGNGIKLILNSDTSVTAEDPDGTSLGTIIDSLDLSNDYEFLTGFSKYRDGSNRYYVWYRVRGSLTWTRGSTSTGLMSGISNTTNVLRIGCLSTDQAGQLVRMYSLQFSNFGGGRRPIFNKSKYKFPTTYEGPNLYTFPSNNDLDKFYCGDVDVYDNVVELYDGSSISLIGSDLGVDFGSYWQLAKTLSPNNLLNTTNGIADSGYNFTEDIVSNEFTIFFDNTESCKFDALSLINIFGVYQIVLDTGDYDFDLSTWSNQDTDYYTIPYETLDVQSSSGAFVTLSNTYENNSLKDFNVLVYNTSTGEYETQLFVKKNFNSVIEFDQNLGSLTNKELRLFVNSCSFSVDDTDVGLFSKSNAAITFRCASSVSIAQIGEVVFGNLIDLSEYITQITDNATSNFEKIESDVGYSYPSMMRDGVILESKNIQMTLLKSFDAYPKVKSLIYGLRERKKPFPFVFSNEQGSWTYYGIIGESASLTPNGYNFDGSIDFIKQNYYPRVNTFVRNLSPILNISSNKSEVLSGESITFTAEASDPEGGAITYLWDFGDETTSTASSPKYSTYSSKSSNT